MCALRLAKSLRPTSMMGFGYMLQDMVMQAVCVHRSVELRGCSA